MPKSMKPIPIPPEERAMSQYDCQKNIAFLNSFGWVGGKWELRPQIAKFIPQDIKQYIEPFGGAAWVLFFKERWARYEVYNDINNNLSNLFTIIKYHNDALCQELETMIPNEALFIKLRDDYKPMTDIQKAARFLYLLQFSFSSQQSYFAASNKTHVTSMESMQNKIKAMSKRLANVLIINRDYSHVINKYDTDGTFFYLDPPYYNYDKGLHSIYAEIEHSHLCNMLKNLKSRFLLSYNDDPFIRELYKDFHILPITKIHKFANTKGIPKKYNELLIANYPLEVSL